MAGARRKNHNVAGPEFEGATAVAAEPNFGAPARDPKHLVNTRVITQIIVDAITPAVAPAVVFEQVLHDRSRIKRARQLDRAPIDDDRPSRVIGNRSVIVEAKHATLTSPQQAGGPLRGKALPAGSALCRFLYVVQQSHDPKLVARGLFRLPFQRR